MAKSAVWKLSPQFPVYPDEPTIRGSAGISHSGQYQTWLSARRQSAPTANCTITYSVPSRPLRAFAFLGTGAGREMRPNLDLGCPKGSGNCLLVALAGLESEAVQLLFEGASAWLRPLVIDWHRALALTRLLRLHKTAYYVHLCILLDPVFSPLVEEVVRITWTFRKSSGEPSKSVSRTAGLLSLNWIKSATVKNLIPKISNAFSTLSAKPKFGLKAIEDCFRCTTFVCNGSHTEALRLSISSPLGPQPDILRTCRVGRLGPDADFEPAVIASRGRQGSRRSVK